MTRELVFSNLRKERRFQTKVVPIHVEKANGVFDYTKKMEAYLAPILEPGLTKAQRLEVIRKVTALGVCALERFGCPERKGNY